jgi:hypothetical protein
MLALTSIPAVLSICDEEDDDDDDDDAVTTVLSAIVLCCCELFNNHSLSISTMISIYSTMVMMMYATKLNLG